MAEWLDNLKVGDLVSLNDSLHKVERFTPTQIILNSGSRFNRKSGALVGASGSWSRSCLQEANETEIDRIRHMRLAARLGRLTWKGFPLEVLRAVGGIVSEYNATQEKS